jgi:hypothetical protein
VLGVSTHDMMQMLLDIRELLVIMGLNMSITQYDANMSTVFMKQYNATLLRLLVIDCVAAI